MVCEVLTIITEAGDGRGEGVGRRVEYTACSVSSRFLSGSTCSNGADEPHFRGLDQAAFNTRANE